METHIETIIKSKYEGPYIAIVMVIYGGLYAAICDKHMWTPPYSHCTRTHGGHYRGIIIGIYDRPYIGIIFCIAKKRLLYSYYNGGLKLPPLTI
jgi:hypothetical protein